MKTAHLLIAIVPSQERGFADINDNFPNGTYDDAVDGLESYDEESTSSEGEDEIGGGDDDAISNSDRRHTLTLTIPWKRKPFQLLAPDLTRIYSHFFSRRMAATKYRAHCDTVARGMHVCAQHSQWKHLFTDAIFCT